MALAWLTSGLFNNPGQLHGNESKLAAQRFDVDEMCVLQKTWQDMADRSQGKGIDKETFLQYFPLTGLLGERLFAQFDKKENGYIDFDEFVTGLSICSRGTKDEKTHFIFNMYDVSHDNTIPRQDLETLVNHIPKYMLTSKPRSASISSNNGVTVSIAKPGSSASDNGTGNESDLSSEAPEEDEYDDVNYYTNHDVAEKCFQECDINHEGRLTYQEFKMWVERTPGVLEYIESILPFVGSKDNHPHHSKLETLPMMSSLKRIGSRPILSRAYSEGRNISGFLRSPSFDRSNRDRSVSHGGMVGLGFNLDTSIHSQQGHIHIQSAPSSPSPTPTSPFNEGGPNENREEAVIALLTQAFDLCQNELSKGLISDAISTLNGDFIQADRMNSTELAQKAVQKEGILWKRGKSILHLWSKRYYLLSGNCMYYYVNKEDIRPKGVIFLTGCLIDRTHETDMELRGYYGIELLHQDLCTGEHHRHDKRLLYCRSEEERDGWISILQHCAQVVPIEDDYVIGRELGRGRFSTVHECVNKDTGVHCAVKVIDKSTIEPEEKALLRTEIAVLKLVDHPNIIKMEGLYESRTHIYIVMEMLKGGELFERIVGRPRFTEAEAAKLIRPLLESVAYLHDLGIVHRDLKPENILCGENLEDLKIADFGLSKMVLPKEKMDAACGTLSYVAPEVLTMQGYGKEADLWSVGVMMYLLLCGKLPFDCDDQAELIRLTIQADLKVNQAIWGKLSEDARSLMTALLTKNPKERISARESLRHPFMLNYCPHHKRSSGRSASMSAPSDAGTV